MWSPSFIGIGAEKSATTWAWTMLDAHPDVCMSQPKELNYFNIDENFERRDSWYRRHFSTDAVCSGEISPLYMDDPRVAERIRNAYPEVRLLVMLRDPFDRALSHLFHDASVRYGTVADLTSEHLKSLVAKDGKYIRRSSYQAALKPFLDAFPQNQIGVHFFDDVKLDGLRLAQDLYRFVGVRSDVVPEQFDTKVNESQDLRSFAGTLMTASRLAKSFPPTRACMNWVYRNTQIRERAIKWLMVDKGRPELTFDDVFGKESRQLLSNDLERLKEMLPGQIPETWGRSEEASSIAA